MIIPSIDNDAYNLFDAPSSKGTPERKLLLAILERAVLDYVGNDSQEIDASTEWLFEDLEDGPLVAFSFRWVCHYLDLEPKKIAGIIKAMPRRGSRRIAPWYFTKHEQPVMAAG